MMNEYYDIDMVLNITVAVKAKDAEEAEEKLYAMRDDEVVALLYEQSVFINDDLTEQVMH